MSSLSPSSNRVDVVIPAFNAAKYIGATLESVALQGDIVQSIIVVNDGSTDETEQIIQSFSLKYPKLDVCYLKQTNHGLAHARNAGIQIARAPYIALLDADDVWVKHKLEKQLGVFHQNLDSCLGVVYCSYQLIDERDRCIEGRNLIVEPKAKGDIYSLLLTGNFISGSGSSVVIKSEVFKKVGLFDENLKASEDWDMWIRISREFHFDFVNEPLVQIRVHLDNMQKDFSRMLASELAMLNKFAQHGNRNYFLLWKIQTILYKKKMLATQILGYENSEPWVKSQLTGNQRWLWKLLLPIANATWSPLKKLKRSLSS